MNNFKEKGITLISLIITIIIILILTVIVVNLALGEKGILNIAKMAGKNYVNAEEKELKDLENLYSSIQIATNDDSQITISIEDLNKIIDDRIKKASVTTVPEGTIISYMGNSTPIGYLACDGAQYKIEDYPALAEQIKREFGAYNYYGGDGETTFAVPNLKGEFLRGTGANSHNNQGSGQAVGVHQDATQHVYFGYNRNNHIWTQTNTTSDITSYNVDTVTTTNNKIGIWWPAGGTFSNGSSESHYTSRPTNTAVLYCIKY